MMQMTPECIIDSWNRRHARQYGEAHNCTALETFGVASHPLRL